MLILVTLAFWKERQDDQKLEVLMLVSETKVGEATRYTNNCVKIQNTQ